MKLDFLFGASAFRSTSLVVDRRAVNVNSAQRWTCQTKLPSTAYTRVNQARDVYHTRHRRRAACASPARQGRFHAPVSSEPRLPRSPFAATPGQYFPSSIMFVTGLFIVVQLGNRPDGNTFPGTKATLPPPDRKSRMAQVRHSLARFLSSNLTRISRVHVVSARQIPVHLATSRSTTSYTQLQLAP